MTERTFDELLAGPDPLAALEANVRELLEDRKMLLEQGGELKWFDRPALLASLESGVGSTIGSSTGGSDPSKRIPIDGAALELLDSIDTVVRRWHRDWRGADAPKGALTQQVLAAWWHTVDFWRTHPNAVAPGRAVLSLPEHTRLTAQWVRVITAMFNPLRKAEVQVVTRIPSVDGKGRPRLTRKKEPIYTESTRRAPCPVDDCGQTTAFQAGTGDVIGALMYEYRKPEGGGPLTDVRAYCRACGTEWPGTEGLQQLREQVDRQAA